MKTKAISSIFVLFAIAAGMASMTPDAFAHPHHAEISITVFDESKLSPYIADMQIENPLFKEAVKLNPTSMLSSLAIMENVESEFLGLGLSAIALNLGIFVALPAFGIIKVTQLRKN